MYMTSYDDLKRNIKNCRFCEEKFGFLPHPVVFGNEDSKIFQISQAPSSSVHMTGKPFDDLSGKRLKYSWYQVTDEIFYNPDNFYITALGHCYPGKTASGGDKQPPKICSEKWLGKELKMVCNDIYVLIGKKAAMYFFPKKDYNELIFSDNIYNGKLSIVLPHPSPLNIKWFKEHPEFEKYRIKEIRNTIKFTLQR